MTGQEIITRLREGRRSDLPFIRWWRRENDFVDYELVDTFMENVRPDQEFADFELLGMEEMWEALRKVRPEGVSREKRRLGEVIVWKRAGDAGEKVCPFTPESLISIFDAETRGNVVDS